MKLRLRPLFRVQGTDCKLTSSLLLLGSRGLGGRFLTQKKRPNGRPLGFGQTATGIPGRLKRGRVDVREDGWDVTFDDRTDWFDSGAGHAAPRPVIGFTRAQRARWEEQAADEAARQITIALRSA